MIYKYIIYLGHVLNKEVQRFGIKAYMNAFQNSYARTLRIIVSMFLEQATTFVTTDVVGAGPTD